jgi:hypothetical protein
MEPLRDVQIHCVEVSGNELETCQKNVGERLARQFEKKYPYLISPTRIRRKLRWMLDTETTAEQLGIALPAKWDVVKLLLVR